MSVFEFNRVTHYDLLSLYVGSTDIYLAERCAARPEEIRFFETELIIEYGALHLLYSDCVPFHKVFETNNHDRMAKMITFCSSLL